MRTRLQSGFLVFTLAIAALGFVSSALGDEITITLDSPTEVYPPGADTADCQYNGDTGPCLIFTGTLTDNDTDGSLISLNDVYTVFDDPAASGYFTVDNTFYNDVPGCLEGDNLETYGCLNSYYGPIFGVGIAADTPVGSYTGTVDIDGSGGSNNAADLLFSAPITIVVSPEPSPLTLGFIGLLAMVSYRLRRRLRWFV